MCSHQLVIKLIFLKMCLLSDFYACNENSEVMKFIKGELIPDVLTNVAAFDYK